MSEKLRTSDEIVLFGRVVEDMAMLTDDTKPKIDENHKLVRVYGVTFDAVYYELSAPVLYVLPKSAKTDMSQAKVPGPDPKQKQFYDSLHAWTVRREDASVRLDVETGKFEETLLADLDEGAGSVSGARVSGARVSGARVAGARVSGARVSGARVSGARVSGARVSGARVSGARVSDD